MTARPANRLDAALRRRKDAAGYRRFLRFYDALERPDGAVFVFFTEGLAPWAHRAAAFVPDRVPLALVGSALAREEAAWLRRHSARPLLELPERVDDKAVWEYLFAAARHDFVWLDADCFVREARVFDDLARSAAPSLPPDAVRGVWSFEPARGLALLRTHLVRVAAEPLREVVRRFGVSPAPYSFDGGFDGFEGARRKSRVPTAAQTGLLSRLLPAGASGRPLYPAFDGGRAFLSERGYFDTLVLYQLVARALGWGLSRVRPLDASRLGDWFTDDVAHVGSVSYYRRLRDVPDRHSQRIYRMLLQAEALVLDLAPALPRSYREARRALGAELERLALDPFRLFSEAREAASGDDAAALVTTLRLLNERVFELS